MSTIPINIILDEKNIGSKKILLDKSLKEFREILGSKITLDDYFLYNEGKIEVNDEEDYTIQDCIKDFKIYLKSEPKKCHKSRK